MKWLTDNWVKVLSTIGAMNSALIAGVAGGMFTKVLGETDITWLGIIGFFMNAFLIGVGVNNTTKEKVAEAKAEVADAMKTAINATPGQGGFVRPMLLAFMFAVAVPAVAVLPGCQSLGLQQAESFDQRYSYAQGQVTALRTVAAGALSRKQISSEDAQYILKVTDNSRTLLDASRLAMGAGDLTSAEGRLSTVTAILAELQNYLRSRGAT